MEATSNSAFRELFCEEASEFGGCW